MVDQWVRFSEKIYEKCLLLFPEAHRREYGALMSQLFHDRLSEVQNQKHPLGFIDLWIRMSTDVATNAVHEHIYEWRQNQMETKNKFEFLVRYHVAELVCGAAAVLISFLSFGYGMVPFMATTASATVIGTIVATLLDGRWRKAV